MATTSDPPPASIPDAVPARTDISPFELLITCNPPILQSLLSQVPTETIFRLYQTSSYLRDFFARSPTSWRYISWRLQQPAAASVTVATNSANGQRQSSNYALDQIILTVINPFSTRLASLELDNTAISGTTLTSTILILRRETLLHVSVRGCKNVSLKYHINPWLQMHALARDTPDSIGPLGFETLALKSLYTYRCRHHRRRPYLPSSLARKESDSEPTHELVSVCHKLGIWTDTAWCTTPGARCYRRRGYVKLRMPQDPREVWVVYDRLWRSRNWLGPLDQSKNLDHFNKKRKRDCRSWEYDEEGMNGEPTGTGPEGKFTPAHLRKSHRKFVENVTCQNCDEEILERCEQCSVMMHCAGCRKTLCASCAFDRPYLRNKNALEDERHKFWWAPGSAISPCSMQDQDLPPHGPANANQPTSANSLPNIKFKWCCTEPLFSGGGGITFSSNAGRDTDRIRAAPLPPGQGWEDPEFRSDRPDSPDERFEITTPMPLGGRWQSIDGLFQTAAALSTGEHPSVSVPRVLCDDCFGADHWKLKCKACATAICLKHDIGDRVKARICGSKDLAVEKQEYKTKQKALKLLATLMKQRKGKQSVVEQEKLVDLESALSTPRATRAATMPAVIFAPVVASDIVTETPEPLRQAEARIAARVMRAPLADIDRPQRPLSPASNSTGPLSRSTSPTPSAHSIPATPEPNPTPRRISRPDVPAGPKWQGCQSFFCPASRTTPGDHRRRCTAAMKQCVECKIHICSDCTSEFDPPCPCKGCQAPSPDDSSNTTTVPALILTPPGTPFFFCPNCRWDRMRSGKCKRKSTAFLTAQSYSLKRLKKRKEKIRKPVEERRTTQGGAGNLSTTEQAIDGLVEFFTSLSTQYPATTIQQGEASASSSSASTTQVETVTNNSDEIRELEDMGALARDLIRRIQRLRDQFRPGSLAALALPNIRVEDEAQAAARIMAGNVEALAIQMAMGARPAIHVPPLPVPNGTGANALPFDPPQGFDPGQVDLQPQHEVHDAIPEMEEFDDEDDGQFEDGETSTE